MDGICKVMGRLYHWSLIRKTDAFAPLTQAQMLSQVVDVFRITGEDSDLDVVMRVVWDAYGEGDHYLGPILCIGSSNVLELPSQWPADALLRLRPRINRIPKDMPLGIVAARVVQWCTSRAFKAVRVKPEGSLWVDYGGAAQ